MALLATMETQTPQMMSVSTVFVKAPALTFQFSKKAFVCAQAAPHSMPESVLAPTSPYSIRIVFALALIKALL